MAHTVFLSYVQSFGGLLVRPLHSDECAASPTFAPEVRPGAQHPVAVSSRMYTLGRVASSVPPCKKPFRLATQAIQLSTIL